MKGQTTYCGAESLVPGYEACGRPAVSPHPDPEISYRHPLCVTHLALAEGERPPIVVQG